MLNKVKIIISILIIIMLTSCNIRQFSFEVDVPPKNLNQYFFRTMSIKNFQSDNFNYIDRFINITKDNIIKEGYIKIVDSNEETILSGFLNIGKVHDNISKNKYECEKEINGTKVKQICYKFTYEKIYTLKVDYKLLDAKNNSIIYEDRIIEGFSDIWRSNKSISDVKEKAISNNKIITKTIIAVSKKIVYAISPHKETINIELQEGNSDSIKLGIKYMEENNFKKAFSILKQYISKSKLSRDKAIAYYILGIIQEKEGKYKDAFDSYYNANLILPNEKLYIKAMIRVEDFNEKAKKVKEWKNKIKNMKSHLTQ